MTVEEADSGMDADGDEEEASSDSKAEEAEKAEGAEEEEENADNEEKDEDNDEATAAGKEDDEVVGLRHKRVCFRCFPPASTSSAAAALVLIPVWSFLEDLVVLALDWERVGSVFFVFFF